MALVITGLIIAAAGTIIAIAISFQNYRDGSWSGADIAVWWGLLSVSLFSLLFSCYVGWLDLKG